MTDTSSSSQQYSSATASTPRQPQQAALENSLPLPGSLPRQADRISWIDEWGKLLSIVAIVAAGIVGYFTSFISVKDDIANNNKEISVLKNDFKHAEIRFDNFNKDFVEIKHLDSSVSVLKSEVATIKYSLQNHKHEKSSK